MKTFLILLGMISLGSRADSQTPGDVTAMLERARVATEQFGDRRVAVASGYRKVGRDLPSMGEHWLNPRLLVDAQFDVTRPAVLTYLMIDGRPQLTGVVYAVPLAPRESPPSLFGAEAKWHEHNGSIDDEALLPEHQTTASAATGTRVAFLHAWLRIPAPEGMFAAENWAIPFIRAGLPVPAAFPNGAARAVSLVTGGKEFFLDLIGSAAAPRAAPFIDECAKLASRIVLAARNGKRALTAEELRQLDDKWNSDLRFLSEAIGEELASRINGGAAAHHH
jgi:hypothetical protein